MSSFINRLFAVPGSLLAVAFCLNASVHRFPSWRPSGVGRWFSN